MLPENLTNLGNNAFSNCHSIQSIIFNCSKLQALGDWAFSSCQKLTTIDLPTSILRVGNSCFANCGNLNKVILRNPNLNIGSDCFNECKALNTAGPLNSLDSEGYPVNIEYAWTTKIPNSAFSAGSEQSYLTEVILAPTIKEIGDTAFLNTKIKTINLPYGLEIIGKSAFTFSKLSSITIPETTTWIKPMAFSYCRSLSEVKIYATTTVEEVTDPANAWFAKCKEDLEIQVHPAIFDETLGILPKQYFGSHWNFYNFDNQGKELFLNYSAMVI